MSIQTNDRIKSLRDKSESDLQKSDSAVWKAVGSIKKMIVDYRAKLSAIKAQMLSRDNYLSARVSSLTTALGRDKVLVSLYFKDYPGF
jgi:hypothetical protein